MPVLSIRLVISCSEVMLPEYVSNYVRYRATTNRLEDSP